eukprot:gene5680-5628_t
MEARGQSPTRKKKEPKTIRVYLRCRPPIAHELARGDTFGVVVPVGSDKVGLNSPDNQRKDAAGDGEYKEFPFTEVFGEASAQADVYTKVARDAVSDVFLGYHGLVFVYGQTGTGKSYTLCNKAPGSEGILVRSVGDLFDSIQADTCAARRDHRDRGARRDPTLGRLAAACDPCGCPLVQLGWEHQFECSLSMVQIYQ